MESVAMRPTVYEGPEPYIFVSYAHRDRERVFDVLSELMDRGYRFWYDDGIVPGTEWPENIALHLDAAAMVIAFITPRVMESQNCRSEITFALSRDKSLLSVFLERTQMSLGMQMQLSNRQCVLGYNYDSWDEFIKRILMCPGVDLCRAKLGSGLVSEPGPVTEPAETDTSTESHEQESAVEAGLAHESVEGKPARVDKPAKSKPTPVESTEDEDEQNQSFSERYRSVIVVLLLMVPFLIWYVLAKQATYTTSWG